MNAHDHQVPATEDFDIVEPYAPALIESLRAVGYDLSTAIADLVDNSIAVLGGRNIANEYFMCSPVAYFVDLDVLSSGPVVRRRRWRSLVLL